MGPRASMRTRSATTDRVMILGLDGATWSVLDPFRSRGLLPNLDALLDRSAYGTLRSTIPPVTTAAWTTMMTGCDPSRPRRVRPPLLRRPRRPDEGQPLRPRPACRRVWRTLSRPGPVGRRAQPPRQLPAAAGQGRGRLGDGRAPPGRRPLRRRRVRRPDPPRGARLLAPLLLEARPPHRSTSSRERPAHRRELPRPRQGRHCSPINTCPTGRP